MVLFDKPSPSLRAEVGFFTGGFAGGPEGLEFTGGFVGGFAGGPEGLEEHALHVGGQVFFICLDTLSKSVVGQAYCFGMIPLFFLACSSTLMALAIHLVLSSWYWQFRALFPAQKHVPTFCRHIPIL